MRLSLAQIVEAVHGNPNLSDLLTNEVTGISTDSRTIQQGELFIALSGGAHNGHNYLAQAFERGAVAALVDETRLDQIPSDIGILIGSRDTLTAYGRIARLWRRKFEIPVVGVTGSVGKTTTKEMMALTLASLGHVLKTDKNENNEVGVPKLLLKLDSSHHSAVVEMGMRGVGQIAYLCEIAEPTVGVICRIGENHIELLGSMERIAQAKGELIQSLRADGLAVLNADDPYFSFLKSLAICPVVTFGVIEASTLRITAIKQVTDLSWSAALIYRGAQVCEVVCPSPSKHDLWNAASAILTAVELGVPLDDACSAIEKYVPVAMRMEIVFSKSGATILNDCYNASPISMRSALETLAGQATTGRRIAFLGDMKELGDFTSEMHESIAAHAKSLGIAEVYAVGDSFPASVESIQQNFTDSVEASEFARNRIVLRHGDVALVKGSRAMEMEKVVEALASS